MSGATAALDAAIAQCDRLRTQLKKKRHAQVRGVDERGLAKATALAWFNNQRPLIAPVGSPALSSVDSSYKTLLAAADKAASRTKLATTLKSLRTALIGVRSELITSAPAGPTTDASPPFAPLIADPQMRSILDARWQECVRCLTADAPLGATVMTGGLLEALLLARINREPNKSPIFTAKNAPKDKSGQTRPLNEWTLKNYIDVAHERTWISVSAKDVGEVLRDYRNYIHPFKQLSHGVHLTSQDATLLWEIAKNIARQIIASAT
jgi:hypothetical protein